MKLTNILIDKLNNTLLFEMAFERKKAKEKVTDISPTLFEHLLKLFILHSPENRQHWISEINGYLRAISNIRLKPSRKKLSFDDTYNWIVYDSAPHYDSEYVTNQIKFLRHDYPNTHIHDVDPTHVMNIILGIIQQVAKDIAAGDFISIEHYLPK